jgi:hypothetical protein
LNPHHRGRRRSRAFLALAFCLIALATQSACGSSPRAGTESPASPCPSLKPWDTPQEELQAFVEAQRPRMEAEAEGYKAVSAGFAALDAGDVVAAATALRRGGELYAKAARMMEAMSPPREFSDLTKMAHRQTGYAEALIDLSGFLDDLGRGDSLTKRQAARGDALIAAFNRRARPWDLAANDYWMQMHIAVQDRHLVQPDWMTLLIEDMRRWDPEGGPGSSAVIL